MNLSAYFESISDELRTLQNRVRLLIHHAHLPTDGEWKESVLRSILRRSASQAVTVGRGFVVEHEWCSSQIDVLLYDNTLPVLYKDGDLVFVTPSSCRAIVEVKTSLTSGGLRRAAEKLARDAALIRQATTGTLLFAGVFSYDFDVSPRSLLAELQSVAGGDAHRVVDHVALGQSHFIKYWEYSPTGRSRRYDKWHLYELPRMAPGYFIHNLLAEASRGQIARRENAWWPQEGKEVRLVQQMPLAGA